VIANEVEATQFDIAALEHCVVTLGSRGAVHYAYGREVARATPPMVSVVDTVGAGDVFCAAYTHQLVNGASDHDALAFAVTAGALATQAAGAQGALPTEDEVRQWLARD
jgi:ribokinase